MYFQKYCIVLFAILLVGICVDSSVITFQQSDSEIPRRVLAAEGDKDAGQTWNYLTVRKKAHMFWWFYETTSTKGPKNVPLILWLQGGPGASGTGFGNFEEIGPLNVKLEARNTTWLSEANLLFVDNPVGAGYSYVDEDSAFCRDVDCIGKDLLTLISHLMYNDLKSYQEVPFYIFSESYGGKMAAVFSKYLYKAMKEEGMPINFRAVCMGDSWIAPSMFVESWAPYLYSTSLVGKPGFSDISKAANRVSSLVNAKEWKEATAQWNEAEIVIEDRAAGVNFYNILKWTDDEKIKGDRLQEPPIRSLYERHLSSMAGHGLTALMNGFIRHKLGIIPDNVTWGGQMQEVFSAQSEEFMKPVIDTVDFLLKSTDLQVVVYNGQLDLICDSLGAEGWVQTLTWPDLPHYYNATRQVLRDVNSGKPMAFVRRYQNFSFYWVLEAGHMIPQDQGASSVMMIQHIFNNGK